MSDHSAGYIQALLDLKAWHGRQLPLRHCNPAWSQAHRDAIELIDNFLIAKGASIGAIEELVPASMLQRLSSAQH